jgi:hypothetical protein
MPDAVHDEVLEFLAGGAGDFDAIFEAVIGDAQILGEAGEASDDAAGEGVDASGEGGGASAEDATEREPVDDIAECHDEFIWGEGVQAALEAGGKEIGLDEIDERKHFVINLSRRQHETP